MLDLKESPADQEDTRQALSPPTELNVSGQSNADILKHALVKQYRFLRQDMSGVMQNYHILTF